FLTVLPPPPRSTLFPYTTLFRSSVALAQAGAPVEGLAFDTMIARYLLQSNERSHGLKDVAFFELGVKMTNISELIGKGKNQLSRSEEHTSELQSRFDLVCRLLLE